MRISLLAITLLFAIGSHAETSSVNFYRSHKIVEDMESSLKFYRDALGLTVTEDRYFNSPKGASNEEATKSSRLVVLSGSDGRESIGLVHHIKPERISINIGEFPFKVGSTTLIFSVEDLESVFAKIKQVEGVKVLFEPAPVTYSAYNGKGPMDVIVSAVQDPNGFAVEINQYEH